MPTPCVSIVMPVYNRATQVASAIDSLLAQTYRDVELIIVDDGSTDGTVDVITAYAANDARVRLLALPANGGQGLARAIGTDAARGRYIAVMDSDDIALPHRLDTQVKWMDAHPEVTLAGAHATKVMADKSLAMQLPTGDGELKARLLLVDGVLVHPTVIMRRDFLLEHNLNYSAERRGDDDYEFFNRMMAAGAVFANMPETVLEYHRHGGNISANTPRLEQDKTPLRRFLLGHYYPDLTGREVMALARIMQRSLTLSTKQAYAGLIAADKAMTLQHSVFGEDHQVLNAIIMQYVKRLTQALNKQV
ncbi:glycosyltransferase family 2 protein [Halomonas llamarensis]|uniref:Glycosyltransferase family 2 protein n=1 Tax=Halomonas llamarensis TaxID=2945104 RepID=A0ABT0SQG8_9GAMM|nr:glycosyltransferase family A protein [Halomonas llamarensis]MCL7929599.1 glycosyltransferase family 2 protein [Halomonas llamarensis]